MIITIVFVSRLLFKEIDTMMITIVFVSKLLFKEKINRLPVLKEVLNVIHIYKLTDICIAISLRSPISDLFSVMICIVNDSNRCFSSVNIITVPL